MMNPLTRLTMCVCVMLTTSTTIAKSASEIALGIDKLGVTGSVLYVAAHPDDENTRLLSYLANELKLRTAYVSLTRGDGGQNLIGTEQAELLGTIRTHELLAARTIDGAEQFFTRAIDFGYSKTAEESLRLWGKDEVLKDLVWVIRRFQPDVLITRFEAGGRPTHGHHTASAILAAEAFEAAADPERYKDQLSVVQPWKVKRLLHNVSHWTLTPETDTSAYLTLDVGKFNPLLGLSMGEVAGKSRSMHKSQGFGAAEERGPVAEYFTFLGGIDPKTADPTTRDPLSGIDFSWNGIPGGAPITQLVAEMRAEFSVHAPHHIIPKLLKTLTILESLPQNAMRDSKIRDVQNLIAQAAGLHLEANATVEEGSPGSTIPCRIEAYARAHADVTLTSVTLPDGTQLAGGGGLTPQKPVILNGTLVLKDTEVWTGPYWLKEPASPYQHTVSDPLLVGEPLGPPPLPVVFSLEIGGRPFQWTLPLSYKWVDAVDGERRRPFVVTPPVAVIFDQASVVTSPGVPTRLRLVIRAASKNAVGTVSLQVPDGFVVKPKTIPFEMTAVGEEQGVAFEISVTAKPNSTTAPKGTVVAQIEIDGKAYSVARNSLDHKHLPPMVLHTPAELPIRVVDLKKTTARVGYIEGPGDKVADSLRQVGLKLEILDDAQILGSSLNHLDTIVTGVRVYSSTPKIKSWQPYLLDFVKKGGTLVVQYSTRTPRSELIVPIAPFALEIGRERVTDEQSPVTFLDPNHPILRGPNPIGPADFEGWVQERGLYFAEKWAEPFVPILEMNDPGEKPLQGSLVVASYGKGHIVYTGLAFFRQLPAGVPGAYRLFSNLVHYGKP